MFDRFDTSARRAVVLAYEQARALNHEHIDTEHLLLGLIHQNDGTGTRALQGLGINLSTLRQKVEELVGAARDTPIPAATRIPLTPQAERVLAFSLNEADQFGHQVVGTEHLLLGLVREGHGTAARHLRSIGADLARLRKQVLIALDPAEPAKPAG